MILYWGFKYQATQSVPNIISDFGTDFVCQRTWGKVHIVEFFEFFIETFQLADFHVDCFFQGKMEGL